MVATAVNILLTFAVLRRLREHGARIVRLEGSGPAQQSEMVGRQPSPFEVVDGTGERLTEETVHDGRTVIGFFSVGCSACHSQAGPFRRAAEDHRFAADRLLVVIDGPAGQDRELVGTLRGLGTLLEGEQAERISAAFGVVSFPAFVTVADGRITAAAPAVALLRPQRV